MVLIEYGHGKRYSTATQCLRTVYHADIWRYVFEKSKNFDRESLSINHDVTHIDFYPVFMQFVGILLIFKSLVMILIEDMSDATITSLAAESKLPFRVEYGEKFSRYLYPIAIHCYLAVFAHISITIAVDTFYIVLIRHACGMFTIVG